MSILHYLSNRLRHFFHVVSNIRPIVWLGLYVILVPIFAFVYNLLPDGQFRVPDGAGTDYGSWLYYSIVTITTLGFGDYTPAHTLAQAVTAVEVMCGLIILGLFLNAVGSMKSEIDVSSEIERQRLRHQSTERDKLVKSIPSILHRLNVFLSYCYAVSTPGSERAKRGGYNPGFKLADMRDLYRPSGLPSDHSVRPAVEILLEQAHQTSLFLDSLQNRVDLTIWPELLEDCFTFVANCQLFHATETLKSIPHRLRISDSTLTPEQVNDKISADIADYDTLTEPKLESPMHAVIELYHFIKANASIAEKMEARLTQLASA